MSTGNRSFDTGRWFGGGRFVWRRDLSSLSLILSNLVTIVMAVAQGWNLGILMWIYWGQSIIIGVANFGRILSLEKFSTENFKINNQPVQPTRETQLKTAFFFLFHYGFFHVGYFVFLKSDSSLGPVNSGLVLLCILTFLLNHAFSFFYNVKRDLTRVPNIGTMMFFPYARIIPLHLTIIFGSFLAPSGGRMIFFLLLKTAADLVMHMIEHSRANKAKLEA